jgi:hypothetical protein
MIQNKLNCISFIHGYPSSALFCFEKLKKTTPSNNTYQITLTCKHYGVPKRNKYQEKHFSAGKTQANFTFIEPQHSTASVHNKSRSANLKRVTDTSTTNNGSNVTKSNESITDRCSCKFSLTICYDYDSSQWFLKKKVHLKGAW